jgi:hypothetical protein
MAGLMDFMGGMFGGTGGYGDLLSDEQKKAMQQQTMMTMAAKLLQAGGPSTTPTNLGQALGGAFLSGQEAYGKAGQNAVQQMLVKQKIDEYQKQQKTQQAIRDILSGKSPTQTQRPTLTPDQITLGATPQASQPGMPPGMPPGMQPGNVPLNQYQQMIARLTSAGTAVLPLDLEQGTKLINAAGSLQDMRGKGPNRDLTKNEIAALGLPLGTLAQRTAGNEIKIIQKPDLAPNDIRLLEAVGLAPTWENLSKLKQSGAASNSLVMPAGQTKGRETVDTKYADDYLQWVQGGGADAIGNLAQVGTVLKQLEMGKELTGPMIGIQPDFMLALTNPNAADAKQRIEEVVQRNLRLVLGAQFTEKEGERLIARAYNPTLSPQQNAARLRRLFGQMATAAQSRQEMSAYFEEKGTLTGYKGPRVNINQFYQALEVKPPPVAGSIVEFNGQKLKFLGGDPNDEANWRAM